MAGFLLTACDPSLGQPPSERYERGEFNQSALGETGKGFDSRGSFPKRVINLRRRIAGAEEGWLAASSRLEAQLLIRAEITQ